MIYADFYNSTSYFQIFMVSKPNSYVLNLSFYFLDTIVKVINKVMERKMSLIKLSKNKHIRI